MSKVLVPIGELAGAIRESARAVLHAHDLAIHHPDGRRMLGAEVESLLGELGRNAAQVVVCLDETDR